MFSWITLNSSTLLWNGVDFIRILIPLSRNAEATTPRILSQCENTIIFTDASSRFSRITVATMVSTFRE